MPSQDAAQLKAEVTRLTAKLATIKDRDIRSVMQARIDEIKAQLNALPAVEEPAEPEAPEIDVEDLPVPTPAQIDEAERLIRQAVLERRRGNTRAATESMEKAVKVAPRAPAVLEAVADDYVERNRYKEALPLYTQALKLTPKNVALERKHAEVVLRVRMAGTIEDQLRTGSLDPLAWSDVDAASLGTARILSFLVPGSGHIVIGKTALGIGLIVAWLGCIGWMIVSRLEAGKVSAQIGASSLAPFFGILVIMLIAVATLGQPARQPSLKKGDRPRPPVDLPFE